jgi:PPM family protein phosphatase
MTTPSALHLTFCAQTHIGQVRQGNEDNFLILDLARKTSWTGIDGEATGLQTLELGASGAVFAVSDGMGGALAGEVASRMAVEIVSDLMPRLQAHEEFGKLDLAEQLRVAIEQSNSTIHIESIVNAQYHGMGATFTAVAIANDHACFAQVGDSRAHLIRDGKITRITKDQSVVQQLIDLGQITEEEAASHPRRNYILQALGATHEIDVVVSYLPLRADDIVLLCSDGLSGKMMTEEMAALVAQAADLREACDKLIELANERGGEDNITVLLARVTGEHLAAPDNEAVAPELIARPPDTPRDFLMEDVGLSPPHDTASISDEQAIADPPSPPTSIESFSSPIAEPEAALPEVRSQVTGKSLDGRKVALLFVMIAVLLSATAVYLNYRFAPDRGSLQERLQQENQAQINQLRLRIAALRERANGAAEINTQLDVFTKRLDEAATLPATKYQQVGQACSEVGNALYLLEQKQSK